MGVSADAERRKRTMTSPLLITQRQEARLILAVARVPEHGREGLLKYLCYGVPPGHFLMAVLANDLTEACGRADDSNRVALAEYISVLHNHAPSESWGSREKVRAWIEQGMELRRAAREATA